MKISYIIPTKNRPTLYNTIASLEMRPGDEICVEFDLPPSGLWGNQQRNNAIKRATGDYLAFIDDDDIYLPGYRDIFEQAMIENPGKPNIFKVKYPDGKLIWFDNKLDPGHMTGIGLLVPNDKTKLYKWETRRNMADFLFIKYSKWKEEDIIWKEEVIALTGHNDGTKNS